MDGDLGDVKQAYALLFKENSDLRADADRYRWLRNFNPSRYAIDLGADIIDINCKEDGQRELDAAIDAALKETQ